MPWKISFKGVVQLLTGFMPHFLNSNTRKNKILYTEMLALIVKTKVGNRPGRVEPRVIKQRYNPFPTLKRERSVEKERLIKKLNKKISKYAKD